MPFGFTGSTNEIKTFSLNECIIKKKCVLEREITEIERSAFEKGRWREGRGREQEKKKLLELPTK